MRISIKTFSKIMAETVVICLLIAADMQLQTYILSYGGTIGGLALITKQMLED